MITDHSLKILLVSSEVAPFAKTGGLADVAGSLPKALKAMGHDVRVVLPRYKFIRDVTTLTDFPVMVGGRKETAIVRTGVIQAKVNGGYQDVPVYFLDNYQYFDRDNMYVYYDEAERFAFFARGVLEMLPQINFQPDVIHCNDWQSGPIPLLLREQYRHTSFYRRMATLFTIHNLQYQGNYPKDTLRLLGLGDEYFHPERIEFYGQVSFMKAGLMYADVISTVSKTYAQEIQTAEFGYGMDGVLRKRSGDLYGIVNGINYHEFNPKTDPRITRTYDQEDPEVKKENKFTLQREVGLPVKDVPLIGLISRLVDQKGLDLIAQVIDDIMSLDLQFVVLGTGDPYYEEMFRQMRDRFPEKMAVTIGFNSVLAQKIYAGADLFLMPSRFEPCGLGQLISLRYGTIPIVRATGGLADTIMDYNRDTQTGNGFSFKAYDAREMLNTIQRALDVYHHHDEWLRLVKSALQQDFSWYRSAAEYVELYELAINKVTRGIPAALTA